MRPNEEIQTEIDQIVIRAIVAIEQGRTDLARYYRGKLEVLFWLSQPQLTDAAVQQAIDQLLREQPTD